MLELLRRLPRDRVGEWFELLHEVGENTEACVGRLRPEAGEVSWVYLPHQRFDGIDALSHAMALSSVEGRLERGKQEQRSPPPLPVRAVRALTSLSRQRLPARGWRCADASWRPDPSRRPRPEALAFFVLSREETALAARLARRQGASLNSLLLWAINQAVARWLDESAPEACWMVPVNMREALAGLPISTNRVAFIEVRLRPEAGVSEVHAAIRGQLSAGAHFTAWDAYQLAGALGLLPRRAARAAFAPPRRTGAFSNIGAWTTPGAEEDAWVICPPPLRSTPFTACVVTCNGRLSLTLELHPSLCAGANDAQAIAKACKERLTDAG